MGRMAIKRLTRSDLTLFDWHFFNRPAGNQKSINLNADVFIDILYPSLLSTDVGRAGRVPLDLFIYGPHGAGVENLQRKIIKGAAYKNWRLDGEYVSNPESDPERFNILQAGDYAVFDFEGDVFPTEARVVFVAAESQIDATLHAGITDFGVGRMRAVEMPDLTLIVHASGTPETHPIHELLLDATIEDAARGGIEGTRRLLRRGTNRRLTRTELQRARQRADDVGRMGEELIDAWFELQREQSSIHGHEWTSRENAISPYDFLLFPAEEQQQKVEVKSTSRDFSQTLHISLAELYEMRDGAVHLYRVYGLDEMTGKLRIAENTSDFAAQILSSFDSLPEGVTTDGVSVKPDIIEFGEEILIDLSEAEDEGEEDEDGYLFSK